MEPPLSEEVVRVLDCYGCWYLPQHDHGGTVGQVPVLGDTTDEVSVQGPEVPLPPVQAG